MDASQLADVHVIEQVLYRYAVAIDTYDLDAFDEIFTPDAQLDTSVTGTLTPACVPGTRVPARAFIGPASSSSRSRGGRERRAIESRTGRRFEGAVGGGACATSPKAENSGWIDDELVRTPGGWRIARRRGRAVWFDGNPGVLELDVVTGANPALIPARRAATVS